MLQSFRDNLKGATAFFLVGIIIIPFALFGVDSIFLSGSSVEEAASVNGQTISKLRVDQAVAMRKQQILSRFQDLAPELVDEEQLRAPVVQELVRQKTLQLEAADSGIVISQKRVYQLLLDTEAFQTDGVFDAERYAFLLRQQGYTPNSYSDLLKEEMMTEQLVQGVTATGFATEQSVALLASVAEQTRDFYYLTIPAAPILDTVEIGAEAVEAFYAANQNQFMSNEQVVVEYIELSTEKLLSEVSVDEAVLREQYKQQQTAAKASESRRVAHILIEEGDDQQVLLDTVQNKLSAGETFAALASEYSADYGTANTGGDLGYSQAGDLPAALEEALQELQVGQVSGPVSSEAGIHILKLVDTKAAAIASFEEQRAGLEQDLKRQLATDMLLERIDELRDYSYNAETLQDTAEQLGLELKQSQPFGRTAGEAVGEAIAKYPAVVKAAFSDDVLANGYVSEVLELSEDRVLVLSLKQHIPAAVKSLKVVQADIQSRLRESAAAEQLAATAEQYQQRLEAGETVEEIAKAEGLEWQVSLATRRIGGNVNSQIRQHAFSLPEPASEQQNSIGGLFNSNGDYVLVSLNKVEQGDVTALSQQQVNGLAASSAMASSSRAFQAYEQLLVDDAEIVIPAN